MPVGTHGRAGDVLTGQVTCGAGLHPQLRPRSGAALTAGLLDAETGPLCQSKPPTPQAAAPGNRGGWWGQTDAHVESDQE